MRSRLVAFSISFGKTLRDLLLGVTNILQTVQEEIVHCLDVFGE